MQLDYKVRTLLPNPQTPLSLLTMRFAVAALAALAAVNAAVTPQRRWLDDPSDNLPSGTVTTKGTEFWLDHYPFYFNGANAYWLPQFVLDDGIVETFEELQQLGVKVVRTWAFSMLTEEDGLPTSNLTYYQVGLAVRVS